MQFEFSQFPASIDSQFITYTLILCLFIKYKRKVIPKFFMLASVTLEMHNNYLSVWSSSFMTSMDFLFVYIQLLLRRAYRPENQPQWRHQRSPQRPKKQPQWQHQKLPLLEDLPQHNHIPQWGQNVFVRMWMVRLHQDISADTELKRNGACPWSKGD